MDTGDRLDAADGRPRMTEPAHPHHQFRLRFHRRPEASTRPLPSGSDVREPETAPIDHLDEPVRAKAGRTPPMDPLLRAASWSKLSALVAVVVALVAGAAGAASVLAQEPTYRSSAVVEVRRQDLFLDVNPGTISVLNALRSKYAALIQTSPIVEPAAEAAQLPASTVRGAIGASITSDSLLFYPFAVAGSPEQARRIAQAATEALVDYADEEQSLADVPRPDRIDLRIVQDAGLGTRTDRPTRRALVVGLTAAALAGAVGFAAVEFGWMRRRAGRED